ncbi:MAG: EamA family transporter [Actinomycetota bacterium]
MAEGFAILSAFCFAGSNIAVRRGTEGTSVLAGLLVTLASGSAVTLVAYVWAGSTTPSPSAVLGFAAAGLLGPAIGRATGMIGIDLLGPARSIPLQGTLYPVAAISFSILLLGEKVSLLQLFGVALVISSVWVLSRREAVSVGGERLRTSVTSLRIPPILFPLIAGAAFGLADLLRKDAIGITPDPLLGTMVGTVTGLVVWALLALFVRPIRSRIRFGAGIGWFVLAGVLGAAAVLTLIRALEAGKVSVVSPIVAAQPLPVLLLSWLFLRRLDRIDARVVLGAFGVVLGTIMISLEG